MKTNQLLGVFFLSITLISHSFAQERLTLTLDNADIMDLARWAQDLTDKTIIVHPAVKGKLSVIAGDPMTRGEAFEVFLSVLDINGFAAISDESTIRIVPKNTAAFSGAPVRDRGKSGSSEEFVVKVIEVKHISVKGLSSALTPLVPVDGALIAYPQTNSIIAIGRAKSIDQIIKLTTQLDVASSLDIDIMKIEFANAKEVSAIVSSLVKSDKEQSLNIAVDERSNSLFITGDPYTRQQVKRIIKHLDQPLAGNGNTQVIRLSYATASKILPILSGVSGSEQENKKDSADKKVVVNIQADDSLNAIIVTAPPSLLSTLKGVIAQLDVRKGQVMVEAIIAEVNEDSTENFGIGWKAPLESDSEVTGGFSSFPSNLSPLSINGGKLSLGTGFSLGYLKGMDIRAVANVLRGEANANILSTPRIMALDNEEASILVGENVPFVTGSQSRPGDLDPFQTIERQDIGVSLKILPKINNENSVTLRIDQKVESIGNTDVETADIITNKREIKTRVIVENGEVLVLGGLIRDEMQISESRVPGLSSIPILGRLFRSTSSSKVKRNLLVFIRPTILPDKGSARIISAEHYNSIKERQHEFNARRDVPFYPRPEDGAELEAIHLDRP